MKLDRILSNLQKFSALNANDYVDHLFEAAFKDQLELYDYIEYKELLCMEHFDIRTVFDLPHGSDEACEAHIISYNKTPFAIVSKCADKTDWHCEVLNAATYREVARIILEAMAEKKLADIQDSTATHLDEVLPNNGYITFVGEDEAYFAVDSPKWMLAFRRTLEKHPAGVVSDDGKVLQLSAIGKFLTDTRSWEGGPVEVEVTYQDGTVGVTEARNILFSVLKHVPVTEAALEGLPTKECWHISAHSNTPHLLAYNRNPYKVAAVNAVHVEFPTPEDYNEFVAKYSPAEVHDGHLSKAELKAQYPGIKVIVH